jgi:hypothetical protein
LGWKSPVRVDGQGVPDRPLSAMLEVRCRDKDVATRRVHIVLSNPVEGLRVAIPVRVVSCVCVVRPLWSGFAAIETEGLMEFPSSSQELEIRT